MKGSCRLTGTPENCKREYTDRTQNQSFGLERHVLVLSPKFMFKTVLFLSTLAATILAAQTGSLTDEQIVISTKGD